MALARRFRNALLQRSGGFRPEIVVFDVTHRCTSRCAGCAFREAEPGELSAARWSELARDAKDLGFKEIVLTGGEPLAHPEISELLPSLSQHLPVLLMTNGLALAKHAETVRRCTREVFVSLDAATEQTYAQIRGVRGLSAVRQGIRALSGHPSHARITVWAENIPELPEIIAGAKSDGMSASSFLACDTTSSGFGERAENRGNAPMAHQLALLNGMVREFRADAFVQMSDYAFDRLLLLCAGGREPARCAAPWTSGVVTPTGGWRPCFFLENTADANGGLSRAIADSRGARERLKIEAEPTCARCVCWRG